MIMPETSICPCCERRCDLTDPQCERGKEYRETGVIPEQVDQTVGGRNYREYTGRGEWHAQGHSENIRKRPSCESKPIADRRKHFSDGEKDDTGRRRHGSGEDGDIDKRRQYRRERYENADTNDRIVINLRELGHKIHYRFEGKGSQERVLCILKERGGITQRELTERLGIKPGSASELLAKLENAGMILRTPNDDDHRMVNISLTETGREQAQKADGLRKKKQEAMFACLTDEEKKALLGLLEKLNRGWECQSVKTGCYGERHRHHSGAGHQREQDWQERKK